ncbi:MAG: transcription factor TFIIH complex subunit Tfb2 [Amphiamblys sp. WSBS2006]|nr:MAG: transcription factor TFIIH complex subunit Tfb2 [Amphiamblys sp. WSBS2006]
MRYTKEKLESFFASTDVLIAIFRRLDAHEQEVLLRFVFEEAPPSIGAVQEWYVKEKAERLQRSLLCLKSLHMIRGEGRKIVVHPMLRVTLKKYFLDGEIFGAGRHFYSASTQVADEKGCAGRWDRIRLFVCTENQYPGISRRHSKSAAMTRETFQRCRQKFQRELLSETGGQLWAFLFELFRDPVADLSFLFSLETAEPGVVYRENGHIGLLSVLHELGLVEIVVEGERSFFVSSLAEHLFSRRPQRLKSSSCEMIVETNFRAYLYTETELDVSIFRFFVSVEDVYSFDDGRVISSGVITEESVQTIFRRGVTADQLVGFIGFNAHWTQSGGLPDNVAMQIRLWEKENRRIVFTEGLLYRGFSSFAEFERQAASAKKNKVLLYSGSEKEVLVVRRRLGADK